MGLTIGAAGWSKVPAGDNLSPFKDAVIISRTEEETSMDSGGVSAKSDVADYIRVDGCGTAGKVIFMDGSSVKGTTTTTATLHANPIPGDKNDNGNPQQRLRERTQWRPSRTRYPHPLGACPPDKPRSPQTRPQSSPYDVGGYPHAWTAVRTSSTSTQMVEYEYKW